MKIDMIMMSRFGGSDGGRETWFSNFMSAIVADSDLIYIRLISLSLKSENVVDSYLGGNIYENIEIKTNKKNILPLNIIFILKLFLKLFFKKKNNIVLGVGSLYEMLSILLCYPPILYKGKRIFWLRTITRKEFGNRNVVLLNLIIFIEKLLLKYFFDIVITNGKDTGDFYEGIGVENIVIPNGVSKEKWYSSINNLKKNRINIAYIGRLEKNKGFIEFCEAAKFLNLNKVDQINFTVIGDGTLGTEATFLQNKLDNFKYLGPIPNKSLPSFLKDIDVCVALTFYNEKQGGGGLSNALLEQMCAGKLIIAWDNVIFKQILNSENSLLVKEGDIELLRKAFLDCLILPQINLMVQKSQNTSLLYSSQVNKTKFIEVLNEI